MLGVDFVIHRGEGKGMLGMCLAFASIAATLSTFWSETTVGEWLAGASIGLSLVAVPFLLCSRIGYGRVVMVMRVTLLVWCFVNVGFWVCMYFFVVRMHRLLQS